jgi:hypothetical protein
MNNTFTLRTSPIKEAIGTEVVISSHCDSDLNLGKVNIRSMLCELTPLEQVSSLLNAVARIDSQWIKCSERLPEYGQEILVRLFDGNITAAIRYWQIVGDLSWDKSLWSTLRQDNICGKTVTHWMPLSGPPRE